MTEYAKKEYKAKIMNQLNDYSFICSISPEGSPVHDYYEKLKSVKVEEITFFNEFGGILNALN